MEWYYLWWPWLTSKRVAQICQHQLCFFYTHNMKSCRNYTAKAWQPAFPVLIHSVYYTTCFHWDLLLAHWNEVWEKLLNIQVKTSVTFVFLVLKNLAKWNLFFVQVSTVNVAHVSGTSNGVQTYRISLTALDHSKLLSVAFTDVCISRFGTLIHWNWHILYLWVQLRCIWLCRCSTSWRQCCFTAVHPHQQDTTKPLCVMMAHGFSAVMMLLVL